MSDFDLSTLARYLHITEGQVQRMAERGTVPGRRVGGAWRFNPSEIHLWLEDRIGAAGEADLAHMEGALERAADRAGQADQLNSLADLLPIDAMDLDLPAKTRGSVISAMVGLAEKTGDLWDPVALEAAVRDRENLYSTAVECGVALLHPRRPMPHILGRPFVAFGRTRQALPFGHARLTDLFFLMCSTDDAGHLHVLARLSRLIAADGFVQMLRSADDARAVHAEIAAREQALPHETESGR